MQGLCKHEVSDFNYMRALSGLREVHVVVQNIWKMRMRLTAHGFYPERGMPDGDVGNWVAEVLRRVVGGHVVVSVNVR
jgi:hypothetical protein